MSFLLNVQCQWSESIHLYDLPVSAQLLELETAASESSSAGSLLAFVNHLSAALDGWNPLNGNYQMMRAIHQTKVRSPRQQYFEGVNNPTITKHWGFLSIQDSLNYNWLQTHIESRAKPRFQARKGGASQSEKRSKRRPDLSWDAAVLLTTRLATSEK